MIVTDKPGRIFAFVPYLVYRGIVYRDKLLTILGAAPFLYEMFWLLSKPPKYHCSPLTQKIDHYYIVNISNDHVAFTRRKSCIFGKLVAGVE